MKTDNIYLEHNLKQIISELNDHHKTKEFSKCKNMGDVLETNLNLLTS